MRESDFPTVEEILSEIEHLPAHVEPEFRESDDDIPHIDVRLQVEEDGDWSIHTGDASYDTSHLGYWGNSSVTANETKRTLREIAADLREQAMEDAASNGELDEEDT